VKRGEEEDIEQKRRYERKEEWLAMFISAQRALRSTVLAVDLRCSAAVDK
jgi:hypothetical protein